MVGSEAIPRKLSMTLILALGLLATVSGVRAAETAEGEPAPSVAHRSKNMNIYAEQDKRLDAAREQLAKHEFAPAVETMEGVLAELELELKEVKSTVAASRESALRSEIFSARKLWGEYLMEQSRQMFADRKYRDASLLASEAALRFPKLQSDADAMVSLCNDRIQNAKAVNEVALENIAPDYAARQQKLARIMAEGQTLYDANDFTGALRKWEEAYLLDPADLEVTQKLGVVYRQLQRTAQQRRQVTSAAMTAAATWTWVEPLFRYKVTDNVPAAVAIDESSTSSYNALDQIVFPTVSFDEAELPVVIEYLNRRSKEYDPEKTGTIINYLLDPKVIERVSVTMDLNNVPLSTVLQVLCLKTGLKFSATDNGHRVTLSNGVDDSGNEEREFKIPNALYSMVAGADPSKGEVARSSASGDDGMSADAGAAMTDFSSDSGSPAVSSSVIPSAQWVACFREMGIDFGPDTSVSHRPNRGTIRVRNNKKNLQAIEKLLPYLGGDKMIMVEVKAIEITDSDYDELGFSWALGESGSVDGQATNNILSKTTNNSQWTLFQGSEAIPGNPMSALRGLTTPIVKNWNIFANLFGSQTPFGSDIPLNISLTINAISMSSRTETLSAPKIITANGEEASLKMGKLYYFPDSWDEPEIDVETSELSSAALITITQPVPQFGEPTFVGMDFKVKPQVLDSRTILVDFNCVSTAYAIIDSKDNDNPEDVYYWSYRIIRPGQVLQEGCGLRGCRLPPEWYR